MKRILKVLSNPIVCIILGALVGIFCSKLVSILQPVSNIFKSVLQVTTIPVLICVITESAYNILSNKFKTILKKFFLAVLLFITVSAVLPTIFALSMRSLITPDDNTKILLSKVSQTENSSTYISDKFTEIKLYGENPKNEKNKIDIATIILDFIPKNIFESLVNSSSLQIVLFFSVFGVLLNYINKDSRVLILNLVSGVYGTLLKFLGIINKFVSFYLFVVIGEIFTKSEIFSVFSAIGGFLFLLFLTGLSIFLFSGIIIKIRTGKGFLNQLKCLKNTLLIAFSTQSDSAATPYALIEACDNLGLDKNTVNIGFPLAHILAPIDDLLEIMLLCFFAIFSYGKPFDVKILVVVFILSLAYSYAVLGASSIATFAEMLKMVFSPLGLPHDLMSVIYLSISNIWWSFAVPMKVHAVLAIVSLIAPKPSKIQKNST